MREKWVLRVPKDEDGDAFIKFFKKYLNTDSYKVIKRYTGKRPKGTSQVSTREENATSTRLYIEEKHPEKQKPYWYDRQSEQWLSPTNARPEIPNQIHLAGSIVPTLKPTSELLKEVKKEVNSTIDKTRLEERIEALQYKIEDLEDLSNKHREQNGSLRVEARELFKVATTMMNILEQIEFSAVDNVCYDEIPWNQLEGILYKYGK